jgi:hypothetical protein
LCLGGFASAQIPKIDVIDFYGLHKVTEAKLRDALKAKEGDPLPASKGDAEERIDNIPGVVESHLEAVYDHGKTVLYVGIEEKGAAHFELREPPEGDARLPELIVNEYRSFVEESAAAARGGVTSEDLTQGHARSADSATRKIQDRFPLFATEHLKELREVLRTSGDEDQRAIAAYIIGYTANKLDAINDLQYALRDADAGVRVNAARSLVAFGVLAKLQPSIGIRISPTWFIAMLNSVSWTDRTRAVAALDVLTEKRDQAMLDQIREGAMGSLVEMARWKTLEHALPAYLLLGRVAGLPEDQVKAAWERGDRESVIRLALGPQGRKRSK